MYIAINFLNQNKEGQVRSECKWGKQRPFQGNDSAARIAPTVTSAPAAILVIRLDKVTKWSKPV